MSARLRVGAFLLCFLSGGAASRASPDQQNADTNEPASIVHQRDKMVLLPLRAEANTAQSKARALDAFLSAKMGSIGEFSVTTPADLDAELGLEKIKDLLNCGDAACGAELGGALNARFVLRGSVLRTENNVVLSLSLLDLQGRLTFRGMATQPDRADKRELVVAEAVEALRQNFVAERTRVACEQGAAAECRELGIMYRVGRGVPRDGGQAIGFLRKACDIGDATGCGVLGVNYFYGDEVKQSDAQAAALFLRGCPGSYLSTPAGFDPDLVTAGAHDATAIDPLACYLVSFMFVDGRGVEEDAGKAFAATLAACEHGFAAGCARVGDLILEGVGVAKDSVRAARYFKHACDHGEAKGCAGLVTTFHDSNDEKRTARALQRACDSGDLRACVPAGFELVVGGDEVVVDAERGLRFLEKACKGGVARGCGILGFLYREGIGVRKNLSKARALFRKGCAGKDSESCQDLERL